VKSGVCCVISEFKQETVLSITNIGGILRHSSCVRVLIQPPPPPSNRDQYNGWPPAEQNADMAVYCLPCTDIMADRFVSLIGIFLPLLLQIFLTKYVIFNTCKQRFRLLGNHRI
jgi:hypothetical protein